MECKKIFDGRKLQRDSKEKIRIAAVKRVEAGEGPEAVARGLGINRRTIYRWLETYHYGGLDALKKKPIKGATPKVNAKQMQKLSKIIHEKDPLQYKFEFALWTLAMIRELIRQLFNIHVSEVTTGRLMKHLGFSPQRPLYRAWQQDPVMVENWRKIEYPKIAKRSKCENALIFFAAESGVRSDYHSGTSWGPKGKTPIVKAKGARYSFNMLAAVNARGHFRFMAVEGGVNAHVFLEFIKRLITGMKQKIFLIVDGHPTHKARLVKSFIEENKDRIELFILPPYAPETNPDELAWAYVKTMIAKKTPLSKEQLKQTIKSVLKKLQMLPKIVAGFFRHPHCLYTNI